MKKAPGSKARQEETERCKAIWLEKRSAKLKERRRELGETFKGFDGLGQPLFADEREGKPMRASEILRALKMAFRATGDPAFDDAIRAFRAYGFDQGGPRRAAVRAFKAVRGNSEDVALTRVRDLVEHGGVSPPRAAEQAVAELGLAGQSFEAVVQQTQKAFYAWRKDGFPSLTTSQPDGDLGYKIFVTPTKGLRVPKPPRAGAPREHLAPSGEEQLATRWWRRRCREGTVSVRRLSFE